MSNDQMPRKPRPIYVIGAGGIVGDAHLPAYKIAGFPVAGIYDLDANKAAALAERFSIPVVFGTMEALLQAAPADAVFDVAVPGAAIISVLEKLPDGAAVLMQKPMGEDLHEAQKILALTRQKKLIAGVNFQLRYAPFIQEARRMLAAGMIGALCDAEVYVNVFTPWHLWTFLYGLPRVEILYHSIHYVDLIRSFLGNPRSVFAKTTKHPGMMELASVRTNIIMDYGDEIRANIFTNHCHDFGLEKQDAYIKLEGTKGAIKMSLGVLMNYPNGAPDRFEFVIKEAGKAPEWKTKTVAGGWFPHAFIGSMAQVMLAAEGSITRPDNSVEDCIDTMVCVEAAYITSERGGLLLSDIYPQNNHQSQIERRK